MSAAVPEAGAADESTRIEPREGSSLYYSLLWTEASVRERFLTRLALVRTLLATLEEVQERAVAERKVHWWHEELERLRLGAPRHPRTLACAASLGGVDGGEGACLELLAVAADTRYSPAASEAELRARLERGGQAALALLAHALSGEAPDLDGSADVRHPTLAHGLGLHATLAALPRLLHRGQAVFSDERYARHSLAPADLARHVRRQEDAAAREPSAAPATAPGAALGAIPVVVDTSAARRALIAETVDEADETLRAALADAAYRRVYRRAELAPIARLAVLRARQLALWRDTRPDLLRERTTHTPLRKLYVAWRHRRGAR